MSLLPPPTTNAPEVWELFQQRNPSQQAEILQLMVEHLISKGAQHGFTPVATVIQLEQSSKGVRV
jgi:hypothetical protein